MSTEYKVDHEVSLLCFATRSSITSTCYPAMQSTDESPQNSLCSKTDCLCFALLCLEALPMEVDGGGYGSLSNMNRRVS